MTAGRILLVLLAVAAILLLIDRLGLRAESKGRIHWRKRSSKSGAAAFSAMSEVLMTGDSHCVQEAEAAPKRVVEVEEGRRRRPGAENLRPSAERRVMSGFPDRNRVCAVHDARNHEERPSRARRPTVLRDAFNPRSGGVMTGESVRTLSPSLQSALGRRRCALRSERMRFACSLRSLEARVGFVARR